jgi:hypothetical protein
MWLDTVTGKRLTTPPSSDGGDSIPTIEENENEETPIELIETPQNDRKRNKRDSKRGAHAMEDSSVEETQ